MSRFLSGKYSGLVPYTPGEQPQDMKYNKLNTNESPFPPSPLAQRLARQAAGDLNLYSDPECKVLVEAASDFYGVGKDRIVFSNGSDEVLNFAFSAFCDESRPAFFPDITYGFYPVFAEINCIPYKEIPLKDDFSIDVSDYFNLGGTIFIANPNAPTGIALDPEEIEKIILANPDNMVVVDEAYVDFGAKSCVGLTDKYDNLLVIQTFSKSRSLAGGRLGLAIACPEVIRDLNAIRYSVNPYNINRMTMYAAVGALRDTEYFEKNCAEIRSIRAYSEERLSWLGFTMTDSRANFIFAKHPDFGGGELYMKLKERGVLVRHFSKPRIDDYLRITVGSKEQMDNLFETLETVLEADR